MRYRFGDFQFDDDQQRLIGPTGPIELRRMSLRVLQILLERAPAVVDKDVLIDAVWGRDALSASSLPQTIRELRAALGDDSAAPKYIATRHRHGYQIVAAIAQDRGDTSVHSDGATPIAPAGVSEGRARRPRWANAATVILCATVIGATAIWHPAFPGDNATVEQAASVKPMTMRMVLVDHSGVDDATAEQFRDLLLLRLESAGLSVLISESASEDAAAALQLRLRDGGDSGMRVSMRLVRLADDREIASRDDAGLPGERVALADRLVYAISQTMAVEVRADAHAAEDRGVPKPGPALDLFLDARTAMKQGRIIDARRLLSESRALDASAPNPHFLYARVALTLGEVGEAKSAILSAARVAPPSAHRKQLMIEATRREIEFGPGRALPVYRALADVNAEDGNSIGMCLDAAIAAGEWRLAEEMLERAGRTKAFSPLALSLAEADLAEQRGDHVVQLAAMRRADGQLWASNYCCPGTVRLALARAERQSGDWRAAGERLEALLAETDRSPDARLRAQALLERARVHGARGDQAALARDLVAAQAGFAEIGDRRGEIEALTERADRALAGHDVALASTLYRTLELVAEELDDPDQWIRARLGNAVALAAMGQTGEAMQHRESALARAKSRGNARLIDAAERALNGGIGPAMR